MTLCRAVNANMTSQLSGQVSPQGSLIGSDFPPCLSTSLGGKAGQGICGAKQAAD